MDQEHMPQGFLPNHQQNQQANAQGNAPQQGVGLNNQAPAGQVGAEQINFQQVFAALQAIQAMNMLQNNQQQMGPQNIGQQVLSPALMQQIALIVAALNQNQPHQINVVPVQHQTQTAAANAENHWVRNVRETLSFENLKRVLGFLGSIGVMGLGIKYGAMKIGTRSEHSRIKIFGRSLFEKEKQTKNPGRKE